MLRPLEFILEAINKISGINRSEGLIAGKEIQIKGKRRGLFKSETIEIGIRKHSNESIEYAQVSATINGNYQQTVIKLHNLIEIFKTNNMLDYKLQMKLDILFNKTSLESYGINTKNLQQQRPPAILVVMGYRNHIEKSWPHLKDKIKIEIINGSNDTQIGIYHNLGWESNDWLSFVNNGILLEAALRNCDLCGIEKLVFFCGDEYADYTINELRNLR